MNSSEERLYDVINKAKDTSEFYRKMLRGISKERSDFCLQDFVKIPFTTSNDVKRAYPFGMAGCDKKNIVEMFEQKDINQDSRNRSTRINGLYSKNDIDNDIDRRKQSLNINSEDIIYFAVPYDCYSAAVHIQNYAIKTGAMCISADTDIIRSSLRRQIDTIVRVNPSIIVVPNFNIYMTVMKVLGISFSNLTNLRMIVLTGMPVSNSNINRIVQEFGGIDVVVNYERVEFGEIAYALNDNKMHVHEDFYVELINPKTTEVIDRNDEGGEIVITSLKNEAMPLIRYRTGEIGKYILGENGQRKLALLGDFNNLIEIRKTQKRLTMLAFEDILFSHNDFLGLYKVKFIDDDNLKIVVEMNSGNDSEGLAQSIQDEIEKTLGISVLVEVVPLGKAREDIINPCEGTSIYDLQEIKNKRKKVLVTY